VLVSFSSTEANAEFSINSFVNKNQGWWHHWSRIKGRGQFGNL